MPENRMKLTDSVVASAALPEGKSEAVFWDTEISGFGLRLRGASKSFIVVYRPAGMGRAANMKRLKIGTVGHQGGEAARFGGAGPGGQRKRPGR